MHYSNVNPKDHPHRRYNPLTGRWVLVSPQCAKPPWQGKVEKIHAKPGTPYDHSCHLCPGNTRMDGNKNPDYTDTQVFPDDFPALLDNTPVPGDKDNLFLIAPARGTARVICYSPEHHKTLSTLTPIEIQRVVDTWIEQTVLLGKDYQWVQVFENKASARGCSTRHPHGQVWATDFLPSEVHTEDSQQKQWQSTHNTTMLIEYARRELQSGERIVTENDHWLAVVPHWAAWPFETMLLPKRPVLRLPELKRKERQSLAITLKQLITKYDNLFEAPFPYSMGWHGAPYGRSTDSHWQLHAHFYPPLLNYTSVCKFTTGFEMLAETQRGLTPEKAAEHLRDLSDTHSLSA